MLNRKELINMGKHRNRQESVNSNTGSSSGGFIPVPASKAAKAASLPSRISGKPAAARPTLEQIFIAADRDSPRLDTDDEINGSAMGSTDDLSRTDSIGTGDSQSKRSNLTKSQRRRINRKLKSADDDHPVRESSPLPETSYPEVPQGEVDAKQELHKIAMMEPSSSGSSVPGNNGQAPLYPGTASPGPKKKKNKRSQQVASMGASGDSSVGDTPSPTHSLDSAIVVTASPEEKAFQPTENHQHQAAASVQEDLILSPEEVENLKASVADHENKERKLAAELATQLVVIRALEMEKVKAAQLEKELMDLRQQSVEKEAVLKRVAAQLDGVREKGSILENELDFVKSDVKSKEFLLERKENEIKTTAGENESMKSEIAALKEAISRLEVENSEKNQLQQELAVLNDKFSKSLAHVMELENRRSIDQERIVKSSATDSDKISALQRKLAETEAQLKVNISQGPELDSVRSELKAAKSELENKQVLVDELTVAHTSLEQENQALIGKLSTSTEELQQLKKKQHDLQEQFDGMIIKSHQIDELRRGNEEIEKCVRELKRSNENLEERVKQLSKETAALPELRATLYSYESRDKQKEEALTSISEKLYKAEKALLHQVAENQRLRTGASSSVPVDRTALEMYLKDPELITPPPSLTPSRAEKEYKGEDLASRSLNIDGKSVDIEDVEDPWITPDESPEKVREKIVGIAVQVESSPHHVAEERHVGAGDDNKERDAFGMPGFGGNTEEVDPQAEGLLTTAPLIEVQLPIQTGDGSSNSVIAAADGPKPWDPTVSDTQQPKRKLPLSDNASSPFSAEDVVRSAERAHENGKRDQDAKENCSSDEAFQSHKLYNVSQTASSDALKLCFSCGLSFAVGAVAAFLVIRPSRF